MLRLLTIFIPLLNIRIEEFWQKKKLQAIHILSFAETLANLETSAPDPLKLTHSYEPSGSLLVSDNSGFNGYVESEFELFQTSCFNWSSKLIIKLKSAICDTVHWNCIHSFWGTSSSKRDGELVRVRHSKGDQDQQVTGCSPGNTEASAQQFIVFTFERCTRSPIDFHANWRLVEIEIKWLPQKRWSICQV